MNGIEYRNSTQLPSTDTELAECQVSHTIVDGLENAALTKDIQELWPCELLQFWLHFEPFVHFVQWLLHYGTALIIIVGLGCNILSLCVLSQKSMRNSSSNLYLRMLAFYDSLALVMNFMVGVLRGQYESINRTYQDSEHLCKAQAVFVEVFNLLSVWIIVAFTIERYLLIVYPLKSKLVTYARTRLTVIGVSVAVIAFSMHKIFISGFEGDSVFGYKACRTSRKTYRQAVYFYVAFNTWLPTIIIFALNMRILVQLQKNRSKRAAMTNNRNVKLKGDDRATRLLLTVSCVYLFLISPLGVTQTIELIYNSVAKVAPGHDGYTGFMIGKLRLKWTRAFFFFFYQINFAINFFLYVSTSSGERFRQGLRLLFRLKHVVMEETAIVSQFPSNQPPTSQQPGPSRDLKPVQSDLPSQETEDGGSSCNRVHPLQQPPR
ncbi:PREDICTED: probable G-protein coupled receptor 139 [Priapulus caudatus]|uniref:Probable G-protein coupled receptor 139 n=1 Tax=Priapulus caudatus TaxID=37621 RepID=A0ABM1F402_PRICU|nr:PREDICTED: probable G-protein coupled receptor 139 [Priapulus caudatus]XP_014679174.1 PREDICTED: probable G-protein coupled receptor 139 [Priapulus caudatus]